MKDSSLILLHDNIHSKGEKTAELSPAMRSFQKLRRRFVGTAFYAQNVFELSPNFH